MSEIKPTPRDKRIGLFADALIAVKGLLDKARFNPDLPLVGGQGLGELLLGGAPEEVDNWAYGNYPVRINPYAGRTASLLPEVKPKRQAGLLDAATLIGPTLASGVGRGLAAGVFGGGMDDVARAAFNPKILKELDAPEYKSREKLIPMKADDFLKLADKGIADDKLANVRRIYESGEPFSSVPQLFIDSTGKVTGHEGRHRAMVELEHGTKLIPVILKSDNIRWTHNTDPKNFDYTKNWPEKMVAQSAAEDPNFAIPFIPREKATVPYSVLLEEAKEILERNGLPVPESLKK